MANVVGLSVWVEPEVRTEFKRKLVRDFDKTVDQAALVRFLIDLYLDGTIDPTYEEVQPYLLQRGRKRERILV
jgi:hypothetical protein